MTESEFLASTEPQAMLQALRSATSINGVAVWSFVSDRKLRLFACACCRSVFHLLTDPRSRRAVEVAERYADGLVEYAELYRACDESHDAPHALWPNGERCSEDMAATAAAWCTANEANDAAEGVLRFVLKQSAAQADLLRHIVGNHWQPLGRRECQRCKGLGINEQVFCRYCGKDRTKVVWFSEGHKCRWMACDKCRTSLRLTEGAIVTKEKCSCCSGSGYTVSPPPRWTPTVRQLAEAVYAGEDCFALHDALEDAGHTDLAYHFWYTRNGSEDDNDRYHPKGCWAVDYLLGKS